MAAATLDQAAVDKRAREIETEYLSSLADLNVNSKPLINMLTILAEENLDYAPIIVNAVEKHLSQVYTLPSITIITYLSHDHLGPPKSIHSSPSHVYRTKQQKSKIYQSHNC